MAYIKINKEYFKKSKIIGLNIKSTLFDNYKLTIIYAYPHLDQFICDYKTTMNFIFKYDRVMLDQLVYDVSTILDNNKNCEINEETLGMIKEMGILQKIKNVNYE